MGVRRARALRFLLAYLAARRRGDVHIRSGVWVVRWEAHVKVEETERIRRRRRPNCAHKQATGVKLSHKLAAGYRRAVEQPQRSGFGELASHARIMAFQWCMSDSSGVAKTTGTGCDATSLSSTISRELDADAITDWRRCERG